MTSWDIFKEYAANQFQLEGYLEQCLFGEKLGFVENKSIWREGSSIIFLPTLSHCQETAQEYTLNQPLQLALYKKTNYIFFYYFCWSFFFSFIFFRTTNTNWLILPNYNLFLYICLYHLKQSSSVLVFTKINFLFFLVISYLYFNIFFISITYLFLVEAQYKAAPNQKDKRLQNP